ncbi:hypothetical protein KI387_008999 [Taxus chinensis]|uniref:Autophagy-related protein 11 n=1 Tax=Taxus chinensis TaxID=29808 RepID=A0AA38CQJ6_TAXCH|nr:hypothetical protein KI387_008999 [Taxus chinensis]
MSSSVVSEDVVLGRRLLVHVAENGCSIEVECDRVTSVEILQNCLAPVTGVHTSEQLLMCGDMRLEPQRSLASYKLPCDGQDVFLYNRSRFSVDCPPPPREAIELPEVPILPPPSAAQSPHRLDDAVDPALKALASYERQFKYHFQKGHLIYIGIQARFEVSKRLLQEQQVQERAFNTARANMEISFKTINQSYVDFIKQFDQQQRHHMDLLTNFERTIDSLRACKLHPTLQIERYESLLDFVRQEDKSLKTLEACFASHRQFQAKVSQLKPLYTELQRRVGNLFRARPSVDVRHEEDMIREHELYFQEQASTLDTLRKDIRTVKKHVDNCLTRQSSASSLRAHDAVSALGPMYDAHDKNYLPRMEACSHEINTLFKFCKSKKHEMSVWVHTSMQKVASLQSSFRDIRFELSAFKEALLHQDGIFSKLKSVHKIGPAYRACLAEVARRKASMELYRGQAGQLTAKLASRRKFEVQRRMEFLKLQSDYIPQDVLEALGLFDVPRQRVVNMEPFETLLDIDVTDLEHYAPESLVSLLRKSDPSTQGKGSLASSSSSYHSGNGEESSVNTGKQYEAGMPDDEYDSRQILGTTEVEIENAWLKAELASAIAFISSFAPDIYYGAEDESSIEDLIRKTAQKTTEALHLKDEYVKHIESDLKTKQVQCLKYEERIQELERKLSDQLIHLSKLSDWKHGMECTISSVPVSKPDDFKSELLVISGDGMVQNPLVSPEPMDVGICSSVYMSSSKTEHLNGQSDKCRENGDEIMADFRGVVLSEATAGTMPSGNSTSEFSEELHADGRENTQKVESAAQSEAISESIDVRQAAEHAVSEFSRRVEGENNSTSEQKEDRSVELQNPLLENTMQCAANELKSAMVLENSTSVKRDLEVSLKLLDESQINCAHLENLLHEAREEAQINLCAADCKSAEYNSLRASSVKLRALLERLRSCVAASSGAGPGFVESLRSLALSLGSSAVNESGDDGCGEFQACIRVLAEKVGVLAQQRADVMERCTRAEASHNHLSKELESNSELVKNLYAKHKMERQVNKERISFTRFEVHKFAAFVPNSAGHYEAINHNCRNYYLAEECIALFIDSNPNGRQYIIGQIVHIQRNVARYPGNERELVASSGSSSNSFKPRYNPYGLPIGTEYFVVTVAMVPNPILSSHA